jgi:hypothetical protein
MSVLLYLVTALKSLRIKIIKMYYVKPILLTYWKINSHNIRKLGQMIELQN